MHKRLFFILNILLIVVLTCDESSAQSYGKTEYNSKIINTSNLIAYIYYQQKGIGPVRNQEIYLVNVNTGKQFRLTNDRFTDSDLCWSPDGNKLLFVSHRSLDRMAKYHDNYNFGYLYIYNFITGKEYSLEKQISDQVDSMATIFRQKGYDIEKKEHYNPDNEHPTWISNNRIGFKRDIYYGHSYGYGELMTTDTLGARIKYKRNPFNKRNFRVFNPHWISEDSIIVRTSPLASFDFKLALYTCSDAQYHTLKNLEKHAGTRIFLSTDKKYIFYIEADKLFKYIIGSGEKHLLNQNMKDINAFIVSPKNDKVACIKMDGENQDIFVMNIDGSDLNQITFDGGYKRSISWSPKKNF